MIDALIDRLPNQIFGFAVVGRTVDARKRHAAEANGGDRETLSAEWPARDSFHFQALQVLEPTSIFICYDDGTLG